MPDLSRRTLLRASAGVAAIAVPMSALAACDPTPHATASEPELKPEELEAFGEPDAVIYNAGQFPANRHTPGMTSTGSQVGPYRVKSPIGPGIG